jgi:hypothetical protein
VTVCEVATRLRASPQSRLVALRFGYRTADEFADWLETHAGEDRTQRLVPALMRQITRAEYDVTRRARARRVGREIVEAIRDYERRGGMDWRSS